MHEKQLPCLVPSLPFADLLVGRADSGMCWLFDLSERLGWADGSNPGSWLHSQPRAAQPGQAAAAAAMSGGGQAGPEAGGPAGEGGDDWEMDEGPEAGDGVSMPC